MLPIQPLFLRHIAPWDRTELFAIGRPGEAAINPQRYFDIQ
jgi:hypothetical protein